MTSWLKGEGSNKSGYPASRAAVCKGNAVRAGLAARPATTAGASMARTAGAPAELAA